MFSHASLRAHLVLNFPLRGKVCHINHLPSEFSQLGLLRFKKTSGWNDVRRSHGKKYQCQSGHKCHVHHLHNRSTFWEWEDRFILDGLSHDPLSCDLSCRDGRRDLTVVSMHCKLVIESCWGSQACQFDSGPIPVNHNTAGGARREQKLSAQTHSPLLGCS